MHAIHASQRTRSKLDPRKEGGVGGLIVSPFSPPNVLGKRSASAGRPTAKASVAPARYGPRSRLAAAPMGIPITSATAADATSAGKTAQPAFPISSDTV